MSAAPAVLIQVRSVSRRYMLGGIALDALIGASCQVRQNERIALVGPSGGGKSTLLHLMAGLDAPSAGDVTWPGLGTRDTLRPTRIGFVFQFPSLVPWLNVSENVALPLQLAGIGALAASRASAALRRFDLDGLALKLPEELSGGQAQRVSLVRAIVASPALVLADEPTGQVDHATGAHLIDMLFEWADEAQAAIVLATHDPVVAERFPIRWEMTQGRLRVPSGELVR
jgi:ABC-type lipoprotein export system ATPase subunit